MNDQENVIHNKKKNRRSKHTNHPDIGLAHKKKI